MPLFGQKSDEMQTHSIGGGAFEFSGARPEMLGATEYTLVTIVCDVTGSVKGFEGVLLQAVKDAATGCQKCSAADNLLLRYVNFSTDVREVHGFQPLRSFDPQTDYPDLVCGGDTALFDASAEAILATNAYAKILTAKDFAVNGIIFLPTDGGDNASRKFKDPYMVAEALKGVMQDEYLESLITILIGVNAKKYREYLDIFHQKAELTQFVDIEDFHDSKSGAKLAGFISKSTSLQNQSLGTGGPSQSLSF